MKIYFVFLWKNCNFAICFDNGNNFNKYTKQQLSGFDIHTNFNNVLEFMKNSKSEKKINPLMHLIFTSIYVTPSVVLSTPLSTLCLHNDTHYLTTLNWTSHRFHTTAQGVENIGRWTQQQDGRKSWRDRVSASNALVS